MLSCFFIIQSPTVEEHWLPKCLSLMPKAPYSALLMSFKKTLVPGWRKRKFLSHKCSFLYLVCVSGGRPNSWVRTCTTPNMTQQQQQLQSPITTKCYRTNWCMICNTHFCLFTLGGLPPPSLLPWLMVVFFVVLVVVLLCRCSPIEPCFFSSFFSRWGKAQAGAFPRTHNLCIDTPSN